MELADTGVDEIELTCRLQAPGDFAHIIQCQSCRNQFVTAKPDAERKVTTNFGTYSLYHL